MTTSALLRQTATFLLIATSVIVTRTAVAQQNLFFPIVELREVGSSSSTISDVNGDGNPDLLITGQSVNGRTATLYLGNGQGGFTEADAGLTGVGESGSTSIADVNGDGNPDLLITGDDSESNPTATLYLGDGQGGFTEAEAGLTGVGGFASTSTSIADVDGDGNKDLLITGPDTNGNRTATLYLGDGQGGFTEANADLTGVVDGSTSIADVNGDSNKDLLIAGSDENEDRTSTLYLGNGEGGFNEAGANLTGVFRASTSIEDVNGDGAEDLLITGSDGSGQTAVLYLGDGQGGFTEAGAGLTGVENGSTSIADVDGDGNRDLLITGEDENFDPSATLYLGDGQGGFTEAGAGLTGVENGSTSIADVDRDGNPDLLITGFDPNGNQTATLYLGDETGSFTKSGLNLTGISDGSSSIADVDGDGDQDLLITGNAGSLFDPDHRVTLYLGDGQYGFTKAGAGLKVVNSSSTSIADVDGDGNPDLLITGTDEDLNPTATLYLGDGQGGFTEADADLTGVENGSTSIADVDGDGNPDLLIIGEGINGPTATLYLGDGQGGFSEANAGLTKFYGGSTSIADVNGDGNPDLLITGQDEGFDYPAILYLGDGQGGFTEAEAGLTGSGEGSTSIADVDADGNLDLLITGEEFGFDPSATLYLGDGQGGFTEAEAGLTGVYRSSTSIADVNGDGNPDLLITGKDANDSETATLYLGNGQGGFTEAGASLTGVQFSSTSIVDIDGDGNLDFLITGEDSGGDPTTVLYGNFSTKDFLASISSRSISGNGLRTFGGTGVEVSFSGTSGSGNVTVQEFSNGPTVPLGVSETAVSDYRFVISAAGNLTFDDNTEVRFDVSSLGGIGNASNVTVYKRLSRGTGLFNEVPTSYDSDANELVATTGSFSEFVFASNSEPLPVELAGFDASLESEKVHLTWQTASEQNNTGFRVQRRETGSGGKGPWTTVGSVDGAGTSSQPQSYRFTDDDLPYEGDRLTYRLKQVDTDGTAHFSKEVTVRRGVQRLQLEAPYPNPAQGQVTVRYALPDKQEVALRLYDVLGRQVRTIVRGKRAGRHEQTLDLSGLSSGVYFLRLSAESETRTRRLTIVR